MVADFMVQARDILAGGVTEDRLRRGPGDFVAWLDPPHDIHSQQGIGEPALELVLFGKDVTLIPRNYYDPETGKVRTALPT